jgi:hypothetical protein
LTALSDEYRIKLEVYVTGTKEMEMEECHSSGSQGEGIAKERVMTGHG